MSHGDEQLSWEPAPGHGPEVLYALDGPLGRARLHRPRAINALDRAAIDSLHQQLTAWAEDDRIGGVFLDGAGERGLCAGGDVRALREAVVAGRPQDAVDYWGAEYAVNALVASYPKPYVAWMDGIVMGGGVGVSAHGSLGLVTERTRLAMPEVIIGFFPDVGGLHPLSHAPGETGTHVALTGNPFGGADALTLDLADALVRSDTKDQVLALLREHPASPARRVVQEVVRPAGQAGSGPRRSWLEDNGSWIEECYGGDDAAQILRRLEKHPDPAAREAGRAVASRSPFSVAVTLEALRRASSMTLAEVLDQDLRLAATFVAHPDFAEGVRAQLVDKDRAPRWVHACVAEVPRDEVVAAFEG